MEDQLQNLGGLKSPHDERDYSVGMIQAPVQIPAAWLPDNSRFPVYDQGPTPSCGGHAGAKLQNILLNLGTNLSPRFVYALCKKIDGIPDQPGTYGRAIMKVLQQYGVCSNDLFPNDTSLPPEVYADWRLIPQPAYIDALPRRIGPYAQVTNLTIQGLKQAVFQNMAVLVLKRPWIPNAYADGHFIDMDGYGKNIRFENSFPLQTSYAGNGSSTGWFSDSDIPTIIEAWTAVDLPAAPPVIPVPPAPPSVPTKENTLNWLGRLVKWLLSLRK